MLKSNAQGPGFQPGPTTNVHLDIALKALDLGLSPLLPKENGEKRPEGDWKQYQTIPATREEVISWYRRRRTGNGLATGYGNLECLEFDDWATYERFKEAAIVFGLGELVDRIEAGYCESTPGGGIHWLYRCEAIAGNTKLAERPAPTDDRPDATGPLIETRGIGGFVVIAPSNGKVHLTGGAYKLVSGGLDSIVTITPDEREALWSLARSFDEVPVEPDPPPTFTSGSGKPPELLAQVTGGAGFPEQGVSPGDDFNARASLADIIEPFGWTKVHTSGGVEYWCRPGKDLGWSATWGKTKGFRVFTSSTSLEAKSHSLFYVYCKLRHRGDWKACVKDLAEQGYGTWIDDDGREHQNPVPKGWKKKGPGPTPKPSPQPQPTAAAEWDKLTDEDLGIRRGTSYRKRRIKWLLAERIPEADYTLVAGRGKQGKSQFTMALGAKISTGGAWWDGSGAARRGHVLYLSAEDDPERIIVPRLEALGADLGNITILEAKYKVVAPDGNKLVSFASFQDLPYWRAVFARIKDPVLLVVDPLPSYMGRGVNDRRNSDVRAILGPFIDLVVEFEMTLLGVTHFGKSIDARNAADKILDSIAYVNLARAIHYVSRDPDDPGRVLVMPGPCNYAKPDLPSLAFRVVEKTIPDGEGGEITIGVPEFDAGTVEADPDDIVNRQAKAKGGARGPDPSETPKLAEWLVGFLNGKGPVFFGEIADAAGQAGLLGVQKWNPAKNRHEWSKFTTLYRAADAVETLQPPNGGWTVVTSKMDPSLRAISGAARWALRKKGSPF